MIVQEWCYEMKEKKEKGMITNRDMFSTILRSLQMHFPEYSKAMEHVEYAVPAYGPPIVIPTERFFPQVLTQVSTGGNEGVILSWDLKFESETIRLGHFKHLDDSPTGYEELGLISGLLVWASDIYVAWNDDLFAEKEEKE